MPIKVTCSNCGGVLHAPDDAGGKRGRCPTCGNILPIPPVEAARGSAAAEPAPAAAPAKGRSAASFGDFAVGQSVGPPPGSAATPADPPVPARAAEPTRRATRPPEDARPDPFARKGKKADDGEVGPGMIRSWKRARAGLGWVRAALFFFLIPLLGFAGMAVYEALPAAVPNLNLPPIPTYDVGYLFRSLSFRQELVVLLGVVPVLLGLLFVLCGRFGLSNAPKKSLASGPALLSGLTALLALAGYMAMIVSPAALVLLALMSNNDESYADWTATQWFFQPFDLTGAGEDGGKVLSIQGAFARFGLTTCLAFVLVGQFLFTSALGRIGTALGDARTAARSNRFQFWLGLVLAALLITCSLAPAFGFNPTVQTLGQETNGQFRTVWYSYVQEWYDKLGEWKAVTVGGVVLLGGLWFAVMHLRMTGAARRAIRGWVEQHDRV